MLERGAKSGRPLAVLATLGRRMAVVVVVLGGVLAWALPAVAETALPEVLLVVDTSASMQHRVGADELPICGSSDPQIPDQKSRWTVVREILAGSFANYQCQYEDLPAQSEALVPPTQVFGPLMCIPGLPHIAAVPYTVDPTTGSGSTTSTGSRTWGGGSGAALELNDAVNNTRTIGWMRFDLKDVPTDKQWVAGSLTLTDSGAGLGVGALFFGAIALATVDPQTATAQDFVCSTDGPGRVLLTPPTEIQSGSGKQTAFQLTEDGAKKLRDLRVAGKEFVHLAIVPAGSQLDAACATVTGTPKLQKITFHGAAATSDVRPALQLLVGDKCPSEGPSKHSIALGLTDLGTVASKPVGKDGILDVLGPSAKFALLAGDGVLSKATTAPGGFSFAGPLSSLWGDINTGMADPYLPNSTSVPITGQDALVARVATYNAIADRLEALRPNGPTPLAAQLEDALQYLGPGDYADPHFRTLAQDPVNGDPYYTCRKKIVVVLSDGGANLHSGTSDGRAAALQTAAKLFAKNVPVLVLAVGHPSETGNGPAAADLQFLDELAAAGGTFSAHVVATPQDAVQALTPVIAETSVVGEVFTRPLYTQATGVKTDVQHAFHAISVYDISQPLRTRGVVEQRIFRCSGECKVAADRAQVCSVVDYQQRLRDRTLARRIYSHKAGKRIDASPANLTPFDLGIGTVGVGPKLELQADGSCVTTQGYNLSDNDERNLYRDHVLETLRGAPKSCREKHPLGAPSRAQMAVLEPAARLGLRDAAFTTYANQTVPASGSYTDLQPPGSAGRPTMLFVATHDGLLHAFRTDADPKIKTKDDLQLGDEMWAFLPRFNQAKISQMKLVTAAEASWLGGSVTAAHVPLKRTSTTVKDAAKQWRAVVIVGAGEAGAGYLALDVTAPDDPRLLWEIAPDFHCFGATTVAGVSGPQCVTTDKYKAMGRSTARPVIANLFYDKDGVAAERAVVVLPLGKAPSEATAANLGVEGLGQRGLFVVDLESGDLVRAFQESDLSVDGTDPGLLGRQWSDVACYNTAPGQIATRCFQGDSKGMIWRVDLSSRKPSEWKMAFFHDAYGTDAPVGQQLPAASTERAPILAPPGLATTSAGQLTLVYGTGGVDDAASVTRRHLLYSLGEAFTLSSSGASAAPKAKRNWVKALASFERFVGPPVIFGFNAYWSSYMAVVDGLCTIGTARLWGARFERPQAVSDPSDLQGAFPSSDKPALITANLDFLDVGAYKPSPVDVLPVPGCTGNCAPTDSACVTAAGGQLGGSKTRYEVGVAVSGNVQGKYQAPKAGKPPAVGTITRDMPQPRTAAVVTGWDLLID